MCVKMYDHNDLLVLMKLVLKTQIINKNNNGNIIQQYKNIRVHYVVIILYFPLLLPTVILGETNLNLNCRAGLRSLTIFSASDLTASPMN